MSSLKKPDHVAAHVAAHVATPTNYKPQHPLYDWKHTTVAATDHLDNYVEVIPFEHAEGKGGKQGGPSTNTRARSKGTKKPKRRLIAAAAAEREKRAKTAKRTASAKAAVKAAREELAAAERATEKAKKAKAVREAAEAKESAAVAAAREVRSIQAKIKKLEEKINKLNPANGSTPDKQSLLEKQIERCRNRLETIANLELEQKSQKK